jgi:SNF2 family DNA or RNA helicase
MAHEIRNCSTKQFQAVHGLTAQHRWCLTGTPIQNSLEDLEALISFLRVPIPKKFLHSAGILLTYNIEFKEQVSKPAGPSSDCLPSEN